MLCLVSCSQTHPTTNQSQEEPTHAFQATLDSLEKGIYPPQHSLLIYQRGELLLEKYWRGDDLVYGIRKNRDFGPEELHGLRSCSKSVVGLLVGIAIHDGLLPSIETPAFTLFPDLDLASKETFTNVHRAITLEHLLTMTDGLDWQQHESKGHVNNEFELEVATDGAAYVWSQPMTRIPGEAFNYNSGATALLARAIQRVSGKNIEEFAAEKLFGPLQITNWEWLKDNDGEPAAHFGLRLSPRDMLKVGRLVLQKGKWNQQQIVPNSWIKAMSNHHDNSRRYGYQWWLEEFSMGDRVTQAVVAYGKGGQTIFVLPQEAAVVVLTAGHYDDNKAAGARKELLEKMILPELVANQ